MNQKQFLRAILGGFIGTAVMTSLIYPAMAAGVPQLDIAALLGSVFGHGRPPIGSTFWWVGMLWHFVNGSIIFPIIYAYCFYRWLPGSPSLRGTLFGLGLWLFVEVAVMPMMGRGFFNEHAFKSVPQIAGEFMLRAVYGVLMGSITGVQAVNLQLHHHH